MTDFLDLPDDFLELSQAIGDDWLLCQHQGGNTSIKHTTGLIIKASGRSLSQSKLDPLNTFISENEREFSLGVHRRFSIETPLHKALSHKYVFHFHPVDILVLSCINKLEDLRVDLAQNIEMLLSIEVLPYMNPGIDLANELISRQIDCSRPAVILLASHGIVIASDSVSVACDILTIVREVSSLLVNSVLPRFRDIKQIASRLIDEFPKSPFDINMSKLGIHELSLMWLVTQDSYLYPDHGVFYKPLGGLFDLGSLAPRPDRVGICLDADNLTIQLPDALTRSHREHAVLIILLVIGMSTLEWCSYKLLPSSLLDCLVTSDAELFRLANA